MRLRDVMLAALGLATVYAFRGHVGRLATRATGTWVGRP